LVPNFEFRTGGPTTEFRVGQKGKQNDIYHPAPDLGMTLVAGIRKNTKTYKFREVP
jgi:hypothetical protein